MIRADPFPLIGCLDDKSLAAFLFFDTVFG